MTSVQAAYPPAILSWTDRDNGETVQAGDVNTLAAEIIAIETTLGTNLQNEPAPPVGIPIAYSSAGNRITDAMNSAKMPYSSLATASTTIGNVVAGVVNNYTVDDDPFNMFNGTDITISADGWWVISASQTWAWWDVGYSYHVLTLNGFTNIVDDDMVNWEFPGNSVTQGVPGRWQVYGRRSRLTSVFWQGAAHRGDRFSCLSENGTTSATQIISGLRMKASMIVSFENNSNFISG